MSAGDTPSDKSYCERWVELAMSGRHSSDHLYGLTPIPIDLLMELLPLALLADYKRESA